MIYDVKQVMTYSYSGQVPFSRHVARMLPRERPGQRVISADLSIDPPVSESSQSTDFFGNRLSFFTIDRPHDRLKVVLKSRVVVEATEPVLAGLTPPWEDVRETAQNTVDISANSPVHHLFPSRIVALTPEIGAYAAESFKEGRPILEAATDLMMRIKTDFKYKPGSTDARTLAAEAFAKKQGVCQDFAHVMIAGMRWLGLPAAYVSGYLRTSPPPGRPRLEGADATHAWAQVWCGPEAGWVGLDPTNGIPAGEDHIVIAIGRDYADVSPMDGVIVAAGAHSVDVAVDVIPMSQTPNRRPPAKA